MPGSQHEIVVIGTGYVGLTTGACLARLGHRVTCVDIDAAKLAAIEEGRLPIHEDGLLELVTAGQKAGGLKFTTDLLSSVGEADFVFLCLPTPAGPDGSADMSSIVDVIGQLKGHLPSECVVVNKSTVPVNSAKMIADLLGEPRVDVVSNPEFLREGSAVEDFLNPDRIVIGSDDPLAGERVGALYLGSRCPVLVTDPVSAETIKYLANAFLAMKISFVNQAAEFCDVVGADVLEVMRGLSYDPRIGSEFLNPGPGWGGSCFPKDTRALAASARALGRPMTLVDEAIGANDEHIAYVANVILEACESFEHRPKIGVLGLSFKANTDDTRESPALAIIDRLVRYPAEVVAYDRLARVEDTAGLARCDNLTDVLTGADVVAILTEWPEFTELSPSDFSGTMRGNTIVDTRYVLDTGLFAESGLRVVSVGRQRPRIDKR